MARVFELKIMKDEWTHLFKTLGSRKVQKMIGDVGNKVCHHVKTNLQNSLQQKRLIWTGKLQRSIKVNRRGNVNTVGMLGYGFPLDRMRTHWVSLKRGRNITKWFDEKIGGKRPRAIRVRAHPWIRNPLAQGLRNTKRILRQETNKLLKQAKFGG